MRSRKVDGEFTVLVYRDGEIFTVNPGGTVRVGLPFMTEAEQQLKDAGVTRALICGELYVDHTDSKRERVHDVIAFARSPESQDDLNRLHFRPFDWMEIDGQAPTSFREAWDRLVKLFGTGKTCRPVETEMAKNAADIEKMVCQRRRNQRGGRTGPTQRIGRKLQDQAASFARCGCHRLHRMHGRACRTDARSVVGRHAQRWFAASAVSSRRWIHR